MRTFLAACLVWALGAPAAFALPAMSPKAVVAAKADPIENVAKRGGKVAKTGGRKSRGSGSSGIHPLVGSGDY
jgi:hypothetical protein